MTGKPRKPQSETCTPSTPLFIGDEVVDLNTFKSGVIVQVLTSGAVMVSVDSGKGDNLIYMAPNSFKVVNIPKEELIKRLHSYIDVALAIRDEEMFKHYAEELSRVSLSRYEVAIIEDRKVAEKPVITKYNRRRELEIVADLFLDMGNVEMFNEYSEELRGKLEGER